MPIVIHDDTPVTEEALLPLWLAGFSQDEQHAAAASSFSRLWTQFLAQQPGLQTRSTKMLEQTLESELAADEDIPFVYVIQHEYAIIPPAADLGAVNNEVSHHHDYIIASDGATTCHIVAIRDPISGAIGLCHVDTLDSVSHLAQIEGTIQQRRSAASPSSSLPPTPFDLFIVGGYTDLNAEALTALLLHYFVKRSHLQYRLQVCLVSSTNTIMIDDPLQSAHHHHHHHHHQDEEASSMTTAEVRRRCPSPICRAFGLRWSDGKCFAGYQLPEAVRGPCLSLRHARLLSSCADELMELKLSTIPLSSLLRATPDATDEDEEKKEEETVLCLGLPPFSFSASRPMNTLLAMEDDRKLVMITSTSPSVESPTYVKEMRKCLFLLVHTRPENHFPDKGTRPALHPLPMLRRRVVARWVDNVQSKEQLQRDRCEY